MKNIKHYGKRLLALVLSLIMCFGLLQTTSLAASWNPGDKITINVRVYDESTGAVYNVGTDSVTKGDQYIQSVAYKIPQLTQFVSASQFGRVTKVVGNWYFPAGDSQPGATVEWSCNASSVTMTYWVNWYSTGSGSGSGSDQNENVSLGTSGSNTWTQYITYHSNYPSGPNYSYTVAYNIRAFTTIYNTFGNVIKSLSAVGFSAPDGYTAKSPIWNTAANGSGTGYAADSNYVFNKTDANTTLHLYAQWQPTGGTVVTPVTLTYMDGNTVYGTRNYFAGDTATAILCTTEKTGYTFAGWDTDSKAQTVVYRAGVEFTINSNMTLYAVWTPDAPTTTMLTVKKLVAGDLSASQLPSTFNMTATIINGSSVQNVFLNSNKLEDSVEISTTASTMVVLNESGYTVDGYDCTSTASNGSAVVNGNVTITIPAGTTNPVCSITNTYVSNVEPNKQLTGFTKTRLTSIPAELGLTGINTADPVNLVPNQSATLLYAITVTGEEGANYTVTDEGTTYVGGDALSGTIGSNNEATIYVTKTITIDDVVEGYVENVAYVEAGDGSDLGDTVPSASVWTNVIGRLTGTKTRTENENRTVDFVVEVTNKVGATLSAVRLTDVMTNLTMSKNSEGTPSYTVKAYSKDGVELATTVSFQLENDGRTADWIIEGMFGQDAKIVLTYSGVIDGEDGDEVEWTNYVIPDAIIATSATWSAQPSAHSVEDAWITFDGFGCEGRIG